MAMTVDPISLHSFIHSFIHPEDSSSSGPRKLAHRCSRSNSGDCKMCMQGLKEHTDIKESYSTRLAQPLKRHDFARPNLQRDGGGGGKSE